jgi:copper chaperone NosL
MKNLSPLSRIMVLLGSAIMLAGFFTPIWRIELSAPQYPEGLLMQIWIDDITGDIDTINGLNHYIGMGYIKPEMFPEFKIMPIVLGVLIGLGFLVAIIGKPRILLAYCILLVLAGVAGMVDFYMWGYDYGHNLDPQAAIKIEDMAYQPPLIGYKQLLNFGAYSIPDTGGWAFVGAGILSFLAYGLHRFKSKKS